MRNCIICGQEHDNQGDICNKLSCILKDRNKGIKKSENLKYSIINERCDELGIPPIYKRGKRVGEITKKMAKMKIGEFILLPLTQGNGIFSRAKSLGITVTRRTGIHPGFYTVYRIY